MDYALLRKLAAQIGRHHTAVRADLQRRGYEIREIRTVASQWDARAFAAGRRQVAARTATGNDRGKAGRVVSVWPTMEKSVAFRAAARRMVLGLSLLSGAGGM